MRGAVDEMDWVLGGFVQLHKGERGNTTKNMKSSRRGSTSRALLQMAPRFHYIGCGGAVDEADRVLGCSFNRSACRTGWVVLTWVFVVPFSFLTPYSSPHFSKPSIPSLCDIDGLSNSHLRLRLVVVNVEARQDEDLSP